MILKQRSEPPEIRQLQSLLQRVPIVHPLVPHWTEKLRRMTAGFHGEQRVDALWNEIPIVGPHYFLHDLYIQKPNTSHQIDTILITSRFVLIIEIKSIAGRLDFDPQLRQFSRTNRDGTVDGMRNPDDQLRRHEKWVQQFLAEHKVSLPVIGAIVFTYPSSIVNSRPKNRIIIQASGLPYLIDQLLAKYTEDLLNTRKTRQLAGRLLQVHSDRPLRELEVPVELKKGVLCEECNEVLYYDKKAWRCNQCNYKNPRAHLQTLLQYRSLVSHTISNREFREFTGLNSVSTASKMLTGLNMEIQGSFKDRIYLIPKALE